MKMKKTIKYLAIFFTIFLLVFIARHFKINNISQTRDINIFFSGKEGNTPENATPISSEVPIQIQNNLTVSIDDNDYWQIYLYDDDILKVDLIDPPGSGDTFFIYLYRSAFSNISSVRSTTSSSDVKSITYTVSIDGIYFIRIYRSLGGGNYNMNVSVYKEYFTENPMGYEETTALHYAGDVDWYNNIYLRENETLDVLMSTTSIIVDFDIYIYNSTANVVASSTGSENYKPLKYISEKNDTYNLQIYSNLGGYSYNVFISVFNPLDTVARNSTILGDLFLFDGITVYRLYLYDDDTIKIQLTDPPDPLGIGDGPIFYMYLYRCAFSNVSSTRSATSSSDVKSITYTVNTEGFYFIKISRAVDEGNYTLSIQISHNPNPGDILLENWWVIAILFVGVVGIALVYSNREKVSNWKNNLSYKYSNWKQKRSVKREEKRRVTTSVKKQRAEKAVSFETYFSNAKQSFIEGDEKYQKEQYEKAIIHWEKSLVAWDSAKETAQNKEYRNKTIEGIKRTRKYLKRAQLKSQNKEASQEYSKAEQIFHAKSYDRAIEKWTVASQLWEKCLKMETEKFESEAQDTEFFEGIRNNLRKIKINIRKTEIIKLENQAGLVIQEGEKLSKENSFDEAISKLNEAIIIYKKAIIKAEDHKFQDKVDDIEKNIRKLTKLRGKYQIESERLLDLEFMKKEDHLEVKEVSIIKDESPGLQLKELEHVDFINLIKTKRHFERSGGNIHYKVIIENKSDSIIGDVRCQLEFPQGAFITIEEKEQWPIIKPGESKPFDFLLHPCFCGKNIVGGWVRYTDAKGQRHPVEIKELEIQIKCPLTVPEKIENLAEAEQVLKFLKQDTRTYLIFLNPEIIFSEVMNVLQRHDLYQILNDPENLRGYFSAKSKIDKDEIIIIALEITKEEMAGKKFHSLSLTIGCQDDKKLTGLLATIHEEVKERIDLLSLPLLKPNLLESCSECGADLPKIPNVGDITKCPSCHSKFYYSNPGILELLDVKRRYS